MFNLITHKINNERSDYLYTHFLLETNGSAPFFIKTFPQTPNKNGCQKAKNQKEKE